LFAGIFGFKEKAYFQAVAEQKSQLKQNSSLNPAQQIVKWRSKG
jgi:hypothetical protein